jgi:peptidoglycan/xylan/chitin deacetylase (PgdA/CDA1 family)
MTPELYVATYHYVRDLPRTRFPHIKGMLLDDFRLQVKSLPGVFEMATLNSALEFMTGRYRPKRNLCLMTFDDGLKEHYAQVTPILAERGIQGIFFPITSCVENHIVAPVHMNHFLLAALGFQQYRATFVEALHECDLSACDEMTVDEAVARRTYPLDDTETAGFKYLFNFLLPPSQRDRVVKRLFAKWIGEESDFAVDLYLTWAEAREMQRIGMVIGGHSHTHRPLARLEASELALDLGCGWGLMRANLESQDLWPFSYPYGKADSYDDRVIETLRRLGFCCSFCTENGMNLPGADLFAIHRVDCKQIMSASHLEPSSPYCRESMSAGTAA